MIRSTPIKMQPQTAELLKYIEDIQQNLNEVDSLTKTVDDRNIVIEQIEELIDLASDHKSTVQSSSAPSKCANRILSIELTLSGWLYCLKMWNSLRQEDWQGAWDQMVSAQEVTRAAIHADELSSELSTRSLNKRLEFIEKTIFPPQIFVSPGMEIGKAVCTICGEEYSVCDHIKYRAYNGELCNIKMEDIEFDHLAFVDTPKDKRAGIRNFE